MSDHRVLDATGDICPLPLLKLKLALREMEAGEAIELKASDRTALQDIPAYCRISGHLLLSSGDQDEIFTFVIQKA